MITNVDLIINACLNAMDCFAWCICYLVCLFASIFKHTHLAFFSAIRVARFTSFPKDLYVDAVGARMGRVGHRATAEVPFDGGSLRAAHGTT